MNGKTNAVLIILSGIVIVCMLVFFGSKLLRPAPSTIGITPTPSPNQGDIDRSGNVDEEDKILVRAHVGCSKKESCWNSVIGKTKDGDNPIYVFDLDLNKDGAITQADLDLVK